MLPVSDPPRIASAPKRKAPEGTVDTHIHMLGGAEEFTRWNNRVEDPAADHDMDEFIARYKNQMQTLGITRAVIVHSIIYGADNAVTIEAIRRFGSDARGIGLLKDGASQAEVEALARAGIKGIRLNYVHGGVLTWAGAKTLAPMLADRGMHIQMLINTDKHMSELAEDIRACPVPVVFDHIGWPNISQTADDKGFQTLCDLLNEGHAYAKLSGIYRLSKAPYLPTDPFVAKLLAANPDRCLWGSDFPYIMLADAKMPDAGTLLDAFMRVVPDTFHQQILVKNPERLYGFDAL
jgi:predicted TIM-barrel fold metal-dependent hydrolase